MKHEFWAEFDLFSELKKRDLIHYFVEKSLRNGQIPRTLRRQNGQSPWKMLKDKAARQYILAQLLATEEKCGNIRCKDYAKRENGLQWWYYAGDLANPRGNFQEFLCRRLRWMASILNLEIGDDVVNPSLPDLSIFPLGSWAIQITFTLRKPYISKDDNDFYIIDNPIKKEWVFKVPYVAPSQWKGALRAAMVRELVTKLSEREIDEEKFFEERIRLYRLFGNEKDGTAEFLNQALARFRVGQLSHDAGNEAKKQWEQRVKQEIKNVAEQFESKLREKGYRVGDVEGFQGNLHFYPTFFDKIGLEVINPHDRKTGTGKQPIYFECVPQGTKGTFTMLYVPMKEIDEDKSKEDLEQVAKGLKAMLTEYGFGAKTSSGYGVAEYCCFITKIKEDNEIEDKIEFNQRFRSIEVQIAKRNLIPVNPRRLSIWRKILSQHRAILEKHFNLSWKEVDFSHDEPGILKQYLFEKRGLKKLNEAAKIMSQSGFQVKFAGVFVHQSPIVEPIMEENKTKNSNKCEIGDLLVNTVWINRKRDPIFMSSFLYQVKKGDRLPSNCQKFLYENATIFKYNRPKSIYLDSLCSHSPYRCWGFFDPKTRSRGLKYLILSEEKKQTDVVYVPFNKGKRITFAKDLFAALNFNTGIPVTIFPSLNDMGWSAIIWDLVHITAKRRIGDYGERGVELNPLIAFINQFNDFSNYEHCSIPDKPSHNVDQEGDDEPRGISILFIFIHDKGEGK